MSLSNKLRKLYDYYHFHSENLIIEPTNKCNLACAVCFRSIPSETGASEGLMDVSLFKEILAKSKSSIKNISLYFRGEPLLHPDIIRFIELIKGHRFSANLSTNGLLLNEGLMEGIIRARLDKIAIDYDYISDNDYEVIRSARKADVVLEKIIAFNALKKNLQCDSPEIVVKAIDRGHGQKKINAYVQRLEDIGIVGKAQVSDCFPWPNIKIQPEFPYHVTPRPKVCGMYYQGLTITYQGNILPCSYDYREDYSVGNIADFGSVAEIYKDASYRSFRRRLLFKKYQRQKPCNACLFPLMSLAEKEFPLNTMPWGDGYA